MYLGSIVGIIVGIVAEASPGERRVAMVPGAISVFNKTGVELLMQPGAGTEAGFPDAAYVEKGVRLAGSREEVFREAEVILQVRSPGANPETGAADLALLRQGQTAIGFGEPLTAGDAARALAERGVTFLAMELMPRIQVADLTLGLLQRAIVLGDSLQLAACGIVESEVAVLHVGEQEVGTHVAHLVRLVEHALLGDGKFLRGAGGELDLEAVCAGRLFRGLRTEQRVTLP